MFPSRSASSTGSLRNTPGSSGPSLFQLVPPLLVNAIPACRKLLEIVSNCRHPTTMLSLSTGFMAMEGSLAASPTMLFPAASTLTWTLTNGPRVLGCAGDRFCLTRSTLSQASTGNSLCASRMLSICRALCSFSCDRALLQIKRTKHTIEAVETALQSVKYIFDSGQSVDGCPRDLR